MVWGAFETPEELIWIFPTKMPPLSPVGSIDTLSVAGVVPEEGLTLSHVPLGSEVEKATVNEAALPVVASFTVCAFGAPAPSGATKINCEAERVMAGVLDGTPKVTLRMRLLF